MITNLTSPINYDRLTLESLDYYEWPEESFDDFKWIHLAFTRMLAHLLEVLLIALALIIALAGIFGLIDQNVSSSLLSIISIMLSLVYSYRRRSNFKRLASRLRRKDGIFRR